MQVRRVIAVGVLALVVVGCSSGSKGSPAATSRPVLSFGLNQENADSLGVCRLFTPASIKALVGGGKKFRIYPPVNIAGRGGPKTRGVDCSWDRSSSASQVNLHIKVVDYGLAQAGLIDSAWSTEVAALGTTAPASGVGDQAVSASANGITTVLARRGAYLVSAVSQAQGGAAPIGVGPLTFLAGAAVRKVAP